MSPLNGSVPSNAADSRGSDARLGTEATTAIVLFCLTGLLILASRWISPSLGGIHQVMSVLVLSTFLAIVAFGQQTVVLLGGLDLSVPSLVTLGGILTYGFASPSPWSLAWVVVAVLCVAACVGAVNGIGVAVLGIPPFLMTLAVGIIVYSAALGITGGTPSGRGSPFLEALFSDRIFNIPLVLYLLLGFIAFCVTLQSFTPFGRKLYALGTNPLAARVAGLPVKKLTIAAFAISASSAALAGILLVGYGGGATLNMGQSYLLAPIAAVLMGGTAIQGGRGQYLGVLAASLLLTTFDTIISSVQIPQGGRTIVYGLLILIAVGSLHEDFSLRPVLAWLSPSTRSRSHNALIPPHK